MITVAPYGPEWLPGDYPEDIPISWEQQVQKAVDCFEAGATVIHLHVRVPETGHGSKDLDDYNKQIERIRKAVPDLVIQVGGSISFAPKTEGAKAPRDFCALSAGADAHLARCPPVGLSRRA